MNPPAPHGSVYLEGNFAPIPDESDFELEVTGTLPPELSGAYYRNGPNPQFPPRGRYHPFTGDGMVHGFFVGGGKVRYRNRYLRTQKWCEEREAGRALYSLAGDPKTGERSVIGMTVANVNVVWHGDRLLALEEQNPPFELDAETLESRGLVDAYGGAVTAHPKIDPDTGELVWFAYGVGREAFSRNLYYGVTDAGGVIRRRDGFEAPYASMAHDFLVTERHVAFPVLPLASSLERAQAGKSPYAWEPDKGGYIGVMPRGGSVDAMKWFEVEPCWVFHPMNAWEVGDTLVADVMEHDEPPEFSRLDGSITPYEGARLVRWTIDLSGSSRRVRRERIDEFRGEFPRIDDRRAGKANRHGWFAGNSRQRSGEYGFDAIAHIDHATGRRSEFVFGEDSPGEPVFVPRPGGEEGDGWVINVVYRAATDDSTFEVFDALHIADGPVATARVPRRVPFGFHGNWRSV
jgi:carotenoid cleavage dioxygenase-like enzyme